MRQPPPPGRRCGAAERPSAPGAAGLRSGRPVAAEPTFCEASPMRDRPHWPGPAGRQPDSGGERPPGRAGSRGGRAGPDLPAASPDRPGATRADRDSGRNWLDKVPEPRIRGRQRRPAADMGDRGARDERAPRSGDWRVWPPQDTAGRRPSVRTGPRDRAEASTTRADRRDQPEASTTRAADRRSSDRTGADRTGADRAGGDRTGRDGGTPPRDRGQDGGDPGRAARRAEGTGPARRSQDARRARADGDGPTLRDLRAFANRRDTPRPGSPGRNPGRKDPDRPWFYSEEPAEPWFLRDPKADP